MAHRSALSQRGLSVLSTGSILAGALILVVSPGSNVSAASTVTGTVFQDFNANGEFDATVASGQATDVGIAGLTVSAYDATGTQVGTATTDGDGDYSIAVTSASGTALRIELEIPTTGPLAALHPSFVGDNNGTTVQFVDAGATDVDIALNVPGEYCQANPSLAVSRLCAGESTQVSGNPSIFVTRYDGGPYTTAHTFTNVYTDWTANTAGESELTGSVLGMAWDPSNRRIYNTAYIRRHAEIYESGGVARPAALFVTTPDQDGLGGSTQFLVDLEGLMAGDQFSNSTSGQLGHVPTNTARKLNRIKDGTTDGGAENDGVDSDLVSGQVGVFEEVGQTGIGDIEVDELGNLYVVSLYDKNLYKVTMPADGSAPTTMTSLGDITSGVTCTNGQGRPFSITRWRGSLYLGMTCDGSGDFPADPSNYSATTTLDTNISFTVRRYDLGAGQWSTVFGPQSLSGIVKGAADGTSSAWEQTARRWNPWTNSYPAVSVSGRDPFGVRPVPMLSDIEFDVDGSMILGFRDRTGDQLATNGSETPIGTETLYPAIASGDIYRVCRTGTGYTAADYVFEGGTGCARTLDLANGTEYYSGDKYWTFHYEISTGMIDQVPGFPDLTLTGFDPYDGDGSNKTFYSGGVRYIQNSTGGNTPSFPNDGSGVLYFANSGNSSNPNTAGGFQKTNGMSDVEALCDAAPVQIGNRVWIDTDKDGIQDPDEHPVAGVTVRLYAADGTTLLGTAVTDTDGEYYFSSNLSEATSGTGDHLGGGLVIGAAHVVRFDSAADYASGGPLDGYSLTVADAGTKDAIDSDATTVRDFPQITIPARLAGETDHTFDVGFILESETPPTDPVAPSDSASVSVGDFVWFDADNDGIQDAGEDPIVGVVLSITDMSGNPVTDINGRVVAPQTTGSDGRYLFTGLPAGQYTVTITYPAGFGPTRPVEGSERADDSSSFTATTRVLAVGESDLSLDFGVIPVVSVGDYVWWDTNRDGRQDSSDVPLAGVTLTITTLDGGPVVNSEGKPVTTTVTDDKGWYTFDNLPLGQYKVTVTAPAGFRPTLAGVGSNDGDSSTGHALSRDLQVGGDRDPTLDFGFVDGPAVLPATGGPTPATWAGLLLLSLGVSMGIAGRRRRIC